MAKKSYWDRYGGKNYSSYDDYDYNYGYGSRSGGYGSGYGSSYGSGYGYNSGFSTKRWKSIWDDDDVWVSKEDAIDKELLIKSPEGYATPTKSSIALKGIQAGKKNYYGQTIKSYSSYDIGDKSMKLIKNMSRFFYHDMMGDGDNPDIFENTEGPELEILNRVISKVRDFTTPFTSPLDKSVYFFNKLKFKPDDSTKETTEDEVKRLVQDIKNMKVDEDTLNDQELQDTKELLVGGLLGGTPHDPKVQDNDSYRYRGVDKGSIIDKVSLIKSWGESFKISKEIKKEVTYNSDKKELLPMTSIEQIVHMDLYQILFPDFNYKLATQTLHVNLPIKKEEKKQKIIMLIDDSGSMSDPRKVEWVMALLTDRLKECRKGEAELFVSKFEDSYKQSRFHFFHIHDETSFQDFVTRFRYSPSGGDTNVGMHIDYLNDQINNHKRLHNLEIDLSEDKVEILVVNDGQDSIKTSNFSYKTNALCLYQTNEELKKLCLTNKGKYITVQGDDRVYEYENEG